MSYSLVTTFCVISIVANSLFHTLPSHARKPVKVSNYPTSGKLLKLTNGDLMGRIWRLWEGSKSKKG